MTETTVGELGLCGPLDLCAWDSSEGCKDPHCYDRGINHDIEGPGPCLPYEPSAALCGQGAEACAPGCCKDPLTQPASNPPAVGVGSGRTVEQAATVIQELAVKIITQLVEGKSAVMVEPGDKFVLIPEGQKFVLVDEEPAPEESILAEAERIVNGPRRASYGHPAVNFARIAHLWNGYLAAIVEGTGTGLEFPELTPQDICQMMIQLKQCRIIQTPGDRDGHVDIAGYAQCSKLIAEKDAADAKAWADRISDEL